MVNTDNHSTCFLWYDPLR